MNHYKNGMMGLIVGDALGVPYEFKLRDTFVCTDMIGYGTYNVEEGSWSDDSSMALATLDSLQNGYNPIDIMNNFIKWYKEDMYTPFGDVFDIGMATADALDNYLNTKDISTCGLTGEYSNGNGSLMRILPVCIYAVLQQLPLEEAIQMVHEVSSLTHAHMRSKMACGFYYFLVKEIMTTSENMYICIKTGLRNAFTYYENKPEIGHFKRLENLATFMELSRNDILSGGYVIESLEAAIYCLVHNDTYEDTVLDAVNLGFDTDTTAAITGGLAGLYYTYDHIPQKWISKIKRKEYILEMCDMINKK